MDFDFELLLVVSLVIMAAVWAYDAVVRAPQRRRAAEAAKGKVSEEKLAELAKEPILAEYARALFPVILIVLLLRSFLFEPFRIPSASMVPTLLVGDFILVNKYAYGLRLPVLHNKLIEVGEPQRGDVMVFRYPEDPSVDYIKRVIGLPGDKVSYNYRTKTLYINDQEIQQRLIGDYTGSNEGMITPTLSRREEDLLGVKHDILIYPQPINMVGEWGEWQVPEKHYFVLGDNRDNSKDSRYWGYVPEENLVGKAVYIWMSLNSLKRIGSAIH